MFYWPSAYIDTLNWVQSYKDRSSRKTPKVKRTELMPITEFDQLFDMVGIDIMDPFPETIKGIKYIVNLSDYYIKWPNAFAMKSEKDTKSETIAKI